MCAIAGFVDLMQTPEIKGKILSTMLRRGPDGTGSYTEGPCTLLHARLAVIDPDGGAQPMGVVWKEEQYQIVYNGELYNTTEMRRELESLGHRFQGHSDTEVVLRGYAQWGEDCVEKFNGIFAFAVWEQKRGRLYLARDRIGVKPLFYKLHEGGLLFSSEIKSILAYPSVRAEVDEQGISELLLLGPGRTSGCGVFRGIQELEPGCCAYYENGKLSLRRYWKLTDREHLDSFEETAEKVRYLLKDAILAQMVSDVPLGAFLSGGLDSSLICAVCAEKLRDQGRQLATFSVDYTDNDKHFHPTKFQPNSDRYYIERMIRDLQCDHHWSVLDPEELVAALEEATRARDLPGMADVDFSLLVFCRRIREHVTVAVSGECADEIFGGYPWYRDPEVRAMDGFPWAQNTKQRIGFLRNEKLRRTGENYINDRYLQTIRACDILPGNSPEERRMKEMVNLNFSWFMQTLLDRKDRMSMYSGLEVRVPFCDYRLAEYMYGVPWEYKDYQGREKGLLRKAMEGILPDEVLYRKKSPYPKTFDPKYFAIVSDRLRNLLNDRTSPLLQIVRRDALEELLTVEYAWPWYGQLMNVPQTAAYMLQIDYWLRAYSVDILV